MAKSRMQIEKFLTLYDAALKENMLREDFARKIGVNADTVYQRIAELRKGGLDIQHLPTGGRTTVVDRARAILEKLRGSDKPVKSAKPKASKVEAVEATVVEDGEAAVSPEDELEKLLGR